MTPSSKKAALKKMRTPLIIMGFICLYVVVAFFIKSNDEAARTVVSQYFWWIPAVIGSVFITIGLVIYLVRTVFGFGNAVTQKAGESFLEGILKFFDPTESP